MSDAPKQGKTIKKMKCFYEEIFNFIRLIRGYLSIRHLAGRQANVPCAGIWHYHSTLDLKINQNYSW